MRLWQFFLVSSLFLLVVQLSSALIRPGYGAWYDVNRPTYYDPETDLPYEWGNVNGNWVLIPRPVGHTYNPLYLKNADGYYARLPGQDSFSKMKVQQVKSQGRFFHEVKKGRSLRSTIMRGGVK